MNLVDYSLRVEIKNLPEDNNDVGDDCGRGFDA
jgi:hypothetical protein